MPVLTIRKLDDDTKGRLRLRAASHGCSMEEEARRILRDALADRPRRTGADLADAIRARFAPFGDIELELPSRRSTRELPRFDE